ncbi:hypothetical protein N9Y89_01445 [bacterium]|nr:hypothetical protein [bacterium]
MANCFAFASFVAFRSLIFSFKNHDISFLLNISANLKSSLEFTSAEANQALFNLTLNVPKRTNYQVTKQFLKTIGICLMFVVHMMGPEKLPLT